MHIHIKYAFININAIYNINIIVDSLFLSGSQIIFLNQAFQMFWVDNPYLLGLSLCIADFQQDSYLYSQLH